MATPSACLKKRPLQVKTVSIVTCREIRRKHVSGDNPKSFFKRVSSARRSFWTKSRVRDRGIEGEEGSHIKGDLTEAFRNCDPFDLGAEPLSAPSHRGRRNHIVSEDLGHLHGDSVGR